MPLPFPQFLPHLQNYQKIFKSFRENSTISDSQRNYSSFLICLTVFFLFADQNLLAPNLSLIAAEFNFNDMERDEKLGGNISFGFFVLGAPAALIVGYLADSCDRCQLFGYVVLLGEISCLATYWVRSYSELFICRVLTGISIGGAAPVIFSLLADYWPGSSRVKMNTFVGIAMSSGVAGGQLIAGLMGPSYGWRSPFLVISIPCLLCALLILTTAVESARGGSEEEVLKMQRSHLKFPSNADDRKEERKSMEINISCNEEIEEDEDPIGTVVNPLPPNLVPKSEIEEVTNVTAQYNQKSQDKIESEKEIVGSRSTNHEVFVEDFEFENNPEKVIIGSKSVHDEMLVDNLVYNEQINCTKFSNLFQTPTVVLLFLQALPGCLPWGVIYVFLNDYFSADRGLSVELATAALVLFGVGGFIGQFCGGAFGQYLYNRDKRLQCLLMGSTTIIAVLPMLYLINAKVVGDALFYIIALIAGIIVSINGPNVRSVLQNVSLPETRGTAFAFFNLADDLGKGAGPVLVVALIKACGGARREAFNIVIMFWLFCGTVLLLMIFTVEKDEKAVQDKVRYSIGRQTTSWESHQDHEGSPHNYTSVDTKTSERTPVKQSDTELI